MRRLLKITLVTILAFSLAGVGLYLWLLNHMEEVVRDFIRRQSKGAVELAIGSASYDRARQTLTLHDTHVLSNETPGSDNRYSIRVERFQLRVGPLRQILASGKLGILDLVCESPSVEVIKLRPSRRNKDFSLPDEISKVYLYLEEALRNLEVGRIRIRNGSFTVRRAYESTSPPLVLKGIDLTVDGIGRRTGSDSTGKALATGDILLETGSQDIRFPDGVHGLRFARMHLDTRSGLVGLDSCFVYGRRSDSNRAEFDILFDSLRIVNADLDLLAEKDVVKADSALCHRPRVRFGLELRKGADRQSLGRIRDPGFQDSVEAAFKQLVGNIDIRHIGVIGADVDITATRDGHDSRYTAKNSDFTIGDLRIVDDPAQPIRVGRFDFEIKDYLGYSSDSLYAIRFDSISLRDRLVGFRNFSIRATAMNPDAEWREVRMRAFELEDVYWPELLFRNRIKADAARLVAPAVELNLSPNRRRSPKPKGSLYTVLSGFRRFVEMDNLYLRDASVAVRSPNGTLLRMDGFNSLVDVRELLESGDATQLVGSIREFSFRDGSLGNSNENISLETGAFDGSTDRLNLERATYRNRRNPLVVFAEGLVLTEAQQTLDNQFKASEISWRKADIRMERQARKPDREPNVQEKPLLIGWERTVGSDTRLSIESGNTSLYTYIRTLQTGSVLIPTDGKPRINGLELLGNSLVFQEGGLRAGIGGYRVTDERASRLTDVRISLPAGKFILQTEIPRLDVVPDLESLIDNKPSISSLHAQRPVVRVRPNPDSTKDRGRIGLPSLVLAELRVTDAVIEDPDLLLPRGRDLVFGIPSMLVRNLRSNSQNMGASEARLELEDIRFSKQGLSIDAPSRTRTVLTGLNFQPGEDRRRARWRMDVDSLLTSELRIRTTVGTAETENELLFKGVRLSKAVWNDGNSSDPAAVLRESGNLGLTVESLSLREPKEYLDVQGIEFRNANRSLNADSLHLRPALDRESFMRGLVHQKDHVQLRSGRIELDRVDAGRLMEEKAVRIGSVRMQSPSLEVYKDRRIPYRPGEVKPLPTALLARIPIPLAIDSLRWREGTILYEELNDVTGRPGVVTLDRTEALIVNARNIDIEDGDSLLFIGKTRLQDRADIRLGFKESYTDTLNGFLLSVRVGPFELTELNEIIEPMASARFRSGRLDTLHMQAVGRNDIAWGKMQMYYEDLRLQFLNREDNERKTLATRLSNLLANTALRQGNRRKTGTVYAERNLGRSVFNYWIRIVLSGALTNAGIRGNDREERKSHRRVRRLDLPAMSDLEVD